MTGASARLPATRKLRDLAGVIRSKNAKPYRITLDVFFDDRAVFEYVKASGALTAETVADLYGLGDEVMTSSFVFDEAMAFKFTFNRLVAQGSVGDSDVYGAQQHAPLMDVEIPWGPDAPNRHAIKPSKEAR